MSGSTISPYCCSSPVDFDSLALYSALLIPSLSWIRFRVRPPCCRATSLMIGDVEIKTTDGVENLLLIQPLDQPPHRPRFLVWRCSVRSCRVRIAAHRPTQVAVLGTDTCTLTREQHKRAATDSLIMVHVREETSLTESNNRIRMVDIR